MLNSQRFAHCGHLWPSSVFKHSPVDGFQIFTNPSWLPLASSPAIDHATSMKPSLPFPQMSVNTYVMVVYASPPLNLRLSPGDRAHTNAKCCHLWPFRHKIFAPVCVQMRWMRPSESPAAMTSPAGPYCTLRISESKRAVSHLLAPW